VRAVFVVACSAVPVLTLVLASMVGSASGGPPPPTRGADVPVLPQLIYAVEWRLIRAGTAAIQVSGSQGSVKLDSAGLVSTLFKVDDTYSVHFENGCTASATLDAKEGRRYRHAEMTIDQRRNRSLFIEKDMLKDTVLRSGQLTIPPCSYDVLGSVWGLRGMNIPLGQTALVPVTDGRRVAQVKVEAQEREPVSTPSGTFQTIRYEAGIMNGVIYSRSGRVFVWVTDDSRRIPVQIRLRMAFPAGTVTLQLEKGLTPPLEGEKPVYGSGSSNFK
jgi:Protein of unknown function (DUF3108)